MIKVFLVVLMFGKVAETVGPLPYSFEECEARKTEKLADMAKIFASHGGRVTVADMSVTPKDVELKCVESITRPKLDIDAD